MFIFRWQATWSPGPKVHFRIAIGMACIAFLLSAVSFFVAHQSVKAGHVVEGVVVKSLSGSTGMHTPVVRYSDSSGNDRHFKARITSRPQAYFVGDRVEVMLSDSGGRPKIKNFITVYGLSAFFGLFSGICAIGTAVIYFTRVKGRTGIKASAGDEGG